MQPQIIFTEGRLNNHNQGGLKINAILKLCCVLAGLGIGLLSLNAQPALADGGGPNVYHFTMTCGNQSYDIVSPANPSAIGQVVGSNSVTVFSILVVTVGSDTFTIYYGPGHGKAVGLQDAEQICTGTDGTATLIAYQFLTPRK